MIYVDILLKVVAMANPDDLETALTIEKSNDCEMNNLLETQESSKLNFTFCRIPCNNVILILKCLKLGFN